ncbi:MAG: large-conductance mechanosensitive channel protein MscL [Bacteroidota bacterium]|jgi:large conductance mechanosensitive channel
MGVIKEFKEFAIRGNLVDLAVAFVMGGAFGKIVSSFVDGMVMPLVGMITGGVDFSDKKLVLQKAGEGVTEVAVQYGQFVTSVIDLLIVSMAVFLIVKAINRLKREQKASTPPAVPVVSNEEKLLTEIRDLLRKNQS